MGGLLTAEIASTMGLSVTFVKLRVTKKGDDGCKTDDAATRLQLSRTIP